MQPTREQVVELLKQFKYPLFTGGKSPNLTLVLLRSVPGKYNCYDDYLCALYDDKMEVFICTGDPGRYYLDNPMRPTGTAILAHPQHIKAGFQMGTHRGLYPCLTQTRSLPVWRDANKDGVVDYGGTLYIDSQGIQIHAGGRSNSVEKFSAGCIAIKADYWPRFIQLAQESIRANGPTLSLSILPWSQ
jgi:hypothetical protein